MKTKKIYELNFKVNGHWHNLLYSSLKRAQDDLNNDYCINNKTTFGIIENSYVTIRILY